MNSEIYFSSDIGRKRRLNEDSGFAGKVKENKYGIEYLLVIADGMGGHSKGEKASQIAVSFLKDLFVNFQLEKFAKRFEIEQNNRYAFLTEILENAFFFINNQIRKLGEPGSVGTTLTVALILSGQHGKEAIIAHVGDSRAYLFYNGQFKQITQDDSLVWELYKAGKISHDEMETHPSKNIITKAVNGEQLNSIQVKKISLPEKSLLLLCSDGLTGMVNDKAISSIIRQGMSITSVGEVLIKVANKGGGKDNISVCLFSNQYFSSKKKVGKKNKYFRYSLGIVALFVIALFLYFGKNIYDSINNNLNKYSNKQETTVPNVPKQAYHNSTDEKANISIKTQRKEYKTEESKKGIEVEGIIKEIDPTKKYTIKLISYFKKNKENKYTFINNRFSKDFSFNDIKLKPINSNKFDISLSDDKNSIIVKAKGMKFTDEGYKKVVMELLYINSIIDSASYNFNVKPSNRHKNSSKTKKCSLKDIIVSVSESSSLVQTEFILNSIDLTNKCKNKKIKIQKVELYHNKVPKDIIDWAHKPTLIIYDKTNDYLKVTLSNNNSVKLKYDDFKKQ